MIKKLRTIMNVKISVFVICIEAIMYFLLYNLHDCNFNYVKLESSSFNRRLIFDRKNIWHGYVFLSLSFL